MEQMRKAFGKFFKQKRIEKNLTIEVVSKDTGMSVADLKEFEDGNKMMGLAGVLVLKESLHIPDDDFQRFMMDEQLAFIARNPIKGRGK
jgi:transcriptional regulator with XRE-family HTH domain